MRVPGFVRTLGYGLLSAVIAATVGIGVLYATQQYAPILSTIAVPGINTFLALSTNLLTASITQNPITIGLSWFIGGFVAGIMIRKRGAGLLGGILTPILLGLITGLMISASVPNIASGFTTMLMTKNFTGGVIAGIASIVGAIPGRIIFRGREMAAAQVIREELYDYHSEPFNAVCQNCQGTIHSNAQNCGICGSPVSIVPENINTT